MDEGLTVRPQVEATAEVRRASSSCCGAKLKVAGDVTQSFACRVCGQPCDRVLSEPEEVTFRG